MASVLTNVVCPCDKEVGDDQRLISGCLRGEPEAWPELIGKYKNLIFSIPLKYGFCRDEAADIFQDVCLKIFSDLHAVREPNALRKWIMQVTSHQCFYWRLKRSKYVLADDEDDQTPEARIDAGSLELLERAEEDQMIREAMASLSPRCNLLMRMLFFEEPSRPYREIATSLGISIGSIGITRQRCISRMRQKLEEAGLCS
jgi:RNA polymerase sigma factor (sigma-70 family)